MSIASTGAVRGQEHLAVLVLTRKAAFTRSEGRFGFEAYESVVKTMREVLRDA